jgi:magnesium-transporting ATPase (P-type)
VGDASEAAILKWCDATAVATNQSDSGSYRSTNPCLAHIPFSSTAKIAASVHRMADDGSLWLILKGAAAVSVSGCIRAPTFPLES